MIEFLSISTLISILLLNLGIIKGKSNVKNAGIIMFVIILIFGWMATGIFLQVNETDYKTDIIYEKNNKEFIIQDSLDNKYIFNKKIDFDYITDTTTFYITVTKNMYGFYPGYNIFYKIGDRKMKGIKE